ncbi:hypothetical protein I3842_10G087500 [Carya illinoinensis]|uniref:RNase H type-1 domain-containing protein n=1 Tax=Carya illinoinensis TaxID=32201 RepID=A0A922J4K7_CARIL|nr:hypothetical protein I3842_10G087500 [Carya illinoinensis]
MSHMLQGRGVYHPCSMELQFCNGCVVSGPISFQKSSLREVNFKDLYEHISEQCDQKLIEMFSVIARNIWLRRKKLLFEGSFLHPNLVLKQASQSLQEFKTVQIGKVHATQVASIHPSVWIPPPTNCVKINWDAAVNVPQDRVGIGLVARDHEGSILIVILEGDALQIVNGINHHAERWDRVGMVLLDTRVLLSSLAQWKVSFVRRGGNQVAHDLAKESLELAENSVVLVTRPPCNHVPSLP